MTPLISSEKLRIGAQQPRARGYSICFIVEPLGPELGEIRHQRALDQLGVEGGHAVDRVAADDRQMRHAYLLTRVLFDERHAPEARLIARVADGHLVQKPPIDLVNNLQVTR